VLGLPVVWSYICSTAWYETAFGQLDFCNFLSHGGSGDSG